jgi:hypothetical protein
MGILTSGGLCTREAKAILGKKKILEAVVVWCSLTAPEFFWNRFATGMFFRPTKPTSAMTHSQLTAQPVRGGQRARSGPTTELAFFCQRDFRVHCESTTSSLPLPEHVIWTGRHAG